VKILIAAGGSGGHIFPAIALARKLKEKKADTDILFVGSNKVLDRNIFEKEGFRFHLLSANKLPYKFAPQTIIFFIRFALDIVRSLFIIVTYGPDIVVGFGGYVSGPVSLVSYVLGILIVAHEQNVVPGRANRFLFKLSDKIAISFKETADLLGQDGPKAVFTGNPIRASIAPQGEAVSSRKNSVKRFGLEPDKFTILVIGGSQGAHFLNEKFVEALSMLDNKAMASIQVIHITGIKDYGWALKRYHDIGLDHRVYSFIDRIDDAYSASDLIVTRSGASAIFEIALFGKPMILVPYPFAMSHQIENARAFSSRGAAIEIEEKDLSAGIFKDKILNLLSNRAILDSVARSAKMLSVPESSDNMMKLVLDMVRKD